ncbi:MAG TPA: septal ring lytic transglycosylase RlpA family protein [Gammaproteobacteria bacterium]
MRRRDIGGFLLLLTVFACAQFPEQPRDTRPWGAPNAPDAVPAKPSGDYGPDHPVDVSKVPDAVPGDDTPSRYGNPSTYTVLGKTYTLVPACKGYHDRGIASWYGMQFHGGRTSDGETYDMYAMTAANKVVPIPCYARVTNLKNGKSVIVKINDRGPFVENRLIDLSYAAASKLDMLGAGTAMVDVQAIGSGDLPPPSVTAPATPAVDVTALPPAVSTAPAPAAGAPQMYLQVGAFGERANADAAVAKLGTGGVDHAFILPVSDGARTLYKVRVGPLADVAAVDALTSKLAGLGFPNAQIVIP